VTRAVLSIGANLGDRLGALQSVVAAFRPWLAAVSPVFETPPWGPVPQDDFLNAVLVVADPSADPGSWLARAQAAEQLAGRTRELRWGPRTLDVDIVDVDGISSTDPQLTLPHPRAHERAFVLVPWLAADPEATLLGRPVRDWLAGLDDTERASIRRRTDLALR
jgi:2-amino-4-hydroxy-6-hydroxymethyldihydropteridine diphosphokinase